MFVTINEAEMWLWLVANDPNEQNQYYIQYNTVL